MLSEEVKRYETLTGESSVGVPISRLGGYLDGYEQGREDAMQYILDRGQSLLESGKLTSEMVMGICLIMGIAKAQMKGENG